MKPNDIAFYKELFVQTANDYLMSLEKNLTSLKGDPDNKDLIGIIHIAFHSLGSQSVAMGYQSTSAFCRLNEAILFRIKENKITISNELIEELIKSTGIIKNSVLNINSNSSELDLSSQIKNLKEKIPSDQI